jgi:hypothetical protein
MRSGWGVALTGHQNLGPIGQVIEAWHCHSVPRTAGEADLIEFFGVIHFLNPGAE